MSNLPVVSPVPLDLPSEAILAWEHGSFTQTDYAGFLLRGDLDVEAMKQAFLVAQESRPTYNAHLIFTSRSPWRTFAWQYTESQNHLEVNDFSHLPQLPDDPGDWLHEKMNPLVETPLDLSNEFAIKFKLLILPEDYCFIVILFHHVVADGAKVYELAKDVFYFYHKSVMGEEPEWSDISTLHAVAGKVEPVKPISTWRFIKRGFGENRMYPIKETTQFATSPSPTGKGRHIVRHIIDDKNLQKALRDRARREGGTLTDLMVSGSKLAIEQWNAEKNESARIMYHGIAVNQRLRQSTESTKGQGNPMSAITIPSNSQDRKDPEALLRYMINERKERLDAGLDVKLAQFSRGLLRVGRMLPINIRYKVLRKILDTKISHFVTNLGIVWPEIKDGKPTGETALRKVGELELVDIHSSVGTTEKNPSVLIVRSFLGRLYMVMVYGKWGVNEKDADNFSKLVYEKVIGYL